MRGIITSIVVSQCDGYHYDFWGYVKPFEFLQDSDRTERKWHHLTNFSGPICHHSARQYMANPYLFFFEKKDIINYKTSEMKRRIFLLASDEFPRTTRDVSLFNHGEVTISVQFDPSCDSQGNPIVTNLEIERHDEGCSCIRPSHFINSLSNQLITQRTDTEVIGITNMPDFLSGKWYIVPQNEHDAENSHQHIVIELGDVQIELRIDSYDNIPYRRFNVLNGISVLNHRLVHISTGKELRPDTYTCSESNTTCSVFLPEEAYLHENTLNLFSQLEQHQF